VSALIPADCQLSGNFPAGLHRVAAPLVQRYARSEARETRAFTPRVKWRWTPKARVVSKDMGVSIMQEVTVGFAGGVPVDTEGPSARLAHLKRACFREVLRSPAHSPRTGVQVVRGLVRCRATSLGRLR